MGELQSLFEHLQAAHNLQVTNYTSVTGGDINTCYRLETKAGAYFIKLNDARRFPQMFEKEADGLKSLRSNSNFIVPGIVAVGEAGSLQYLVMDLLQKAPPAKNFWSQFAMCLAQLHQSTNTHFGWHYDNYAGVLVLENNFTDTWAEFYGQHRLIAFGQQLVNEQKFSSKDVAALERIAARLTDIFPAEPPALLHGDLWSGNYMAAAGDASHQGLPCIFDPAVYYGHREIDIGTTLLFGGFDNQLYDEYNSIFPLEAGWRKRIPLTQLCPLLEHAILFGGGYISQCRSIIQQWS